MNEVVTLGAVNRLYSSLVTTRDSAATQAFIAVLTAPGATSAQVQTWVTANSADATLVFRNQNFVRYALSNPAWSLLIYNSAAAASLAMSSPTWMSQFILDADNVNALMSSTTGVSALASSAAALDAIYVNKDGIGAATYSRFDSLADTVTYTSPSTSAGVPRPIPALSGTNILISAIYSQNNASITMGYTGKVLGVAPNITGVRPDILARTFATYTALASVSEAANSTASFTFKVIPIA